MRKRTTKLAFEDRIGNVAIDQQSSDTLENSVGDSVSCLIGLNHSPACVGLRHFEIAIADVLVELQGLLFKPTLTFVINACRTFAVCGSEHVLLI